MYYCYYHHHHLHIRSLASCIPCGRTNFCPVLVEVDRRKELALVFCFVKFFLFLVKVLHAPAAIERDGRAMQLLVCPAVASLMISHVSRLVSVCRFVCVCVQLPTPMTDQVVKNQSVGVCNRRERHTRDGRKNRAVSSSSSFPFFFIVYVVAVVRRLLFFFLFSLCCGVCWTPKGFDDYLSTFRPSFAHGSY